MVVNAVHVHVAAGAERAAGAAGEHERHAVAQDARDRSHSQPIRSVATTMSSKRISTLI